jgi:predicted nucleic acid-binding Zn finger protein
MAAPFVALGPSGAAVRDRLEHLTAEDEKDFVWSVTICACSPVGGEVVHHGDDGAACRHLVSVDVASSRGRNG